MDKAAKIFIYAFAGLITASIGIRAVAPLMQISDLTFPGAPGVVMPVMLYGLIGISAATWFKTRSRFAGIVMWTVLVLVSLAPAAMTLADRGDVVATALVTYFGMCAPMSLALAGQCHRISQQHEDAEEAGDEQH